MIVALDDRLSDVIDLNAKAEQVATGFRFLEGPVWNREEKCLLFCDPRTHRIQRWSEKDGISVFRENSNSATGLTYDPQGRLVAVEPRTSEGGVGGRQVTRTHADGKIQQLATHYYGKHLSSPNDLVCLANGDVIFTDPDSGLRHGDGTMTPREQPANGVFRVRGADDVLEVITYSVPSPNGLVVRDGWTELLVADSRNHRVLSYDLQGGSARQFVDSTHNGVEGHPDGMKLDSVGNLYIGGGTQEGVWVYAPDGTLLGLIGFEERAINLAWGDDDWQTMYVMAMTSVYRIRMKVPGQQLNPL